MNEEIKSAPSEGLEGPVAFRSADAPREGPVWWPEDLPGKDLRGQDLTDVEGLLPEHLAGADLTGAKLPTEIAKFPALGQVAEISSEARKVFIGLLAACVYSWLVIGTTTDVALILNTASSPLPIINTPIPIAGFYVVGATLLAAVYGYFHFYLQRLWRTLATLPAIFPDGTPLDDRTDPWLLTNLVRVGFTRLRQSAPPLTSLENLLTILLAWWLVPLTLLALWVRFLPAHYWLGTLWLVVLIGVTVVFGRHSYRLARATLRGETCPSIDEDDDARGVSRRAWHQLQHIRPDRLAVGLILAVIVCSLSAFRDNPRDSYTWIAKGLNALNFVGIRTYADLREIEVAERPEGWTGKEWNKISRLDLRGRNLAFADATRAFLANADLRGANLRDAILVDAELQGADLYDDAQKGAQLHGANLTGANLQGADLSQAQLHGANLTGANLQGADLNQAQLHGANLDRAQLQGADLSQAQLYGANLHVARLQGANLNGAQLQGAEFLFTQLQGANLTGAHLQGADLGTALFGMLYRARFEGADLQKARLWRAIIDVNYMDLVDSTRQ